jgi:hypothetical protein
MPTTYAWNRQSPQLKARLKTEAAERRRLRKETDLIRAAETDQRATQLIKDFAAKRELYELDGDGAGAKRER